MGDKNGMLVISRQRDESLMVGSGADLAEIIVVDIRGDKVRLGTKARLGVPVDRKKEVWAGQSPGRPRK